MTEGGQKLVNRYKAWCRGTQGVDGDCLGGALVGGKYLDLQGRYMLAMALSKSPVLEEFQRALGEMVSMRAVLQAAIGTLVTLLVLLALPEPVTKFVAAWATAALVLWVGASTLYDHHIGTNANNISTARGGPWTPRLRKLYARAGMRLEDTENVVPIEGHRGPHPEEYHRAVEARVRIALGNCRSIEECRPRLIGALKNLADEIATPGTKLNQLVTQDKSR